MNSTWEQRNRDFALAQTEAQMAYIAAEGAAMALERENAGLRDLVGDMFRTIASRNSWWDHAYKDTLSYAFIMSDLGIAVSEHMPDNLDLVELRGL